MAREFLRGSIEILAGRLCQWGFLPAGKEEQDYEDDNAHNYAGVRQVEDRPWAELDEVRHLSEADSIGEIANGPSQLEAEAYPKQQAVSGVKPVDVQQHDHSDERGNDQKKGVVDKKPESCARVEGAFELERALGGESLSVA